MAAKIKLRKFSEADIPRLIGWISDARFLLQWAGPRYKYPLDDAQLLATLEKTRGKKPSCYMFAGTISSGRRVVGHIELMSVDYVLKTACLGRVLIGRAEHRGRGYGASLVAEALNYGFNILKLREIDLRVFDFNSAAIACYQQLGFVPCDFKRNVCRFKNERWNLIVMKLEKKSWQKPDRK